MTGKHAGDRSAPTIAPYWKAVVGFVAPSAVILASAVTDASDGGSRITTAEWVTAACAAILTSAGVYAKGNKDPQATHQAESVQPPEGNAVRGVRDLIADALKQYGQPISPDAQQ